MSDQVPPAGSTPQGPAGPVDPTPREDDVARTGPRPEASVRETSAREPSAEELAGAEHVVRRRTPRYGLLITLGALVGAVVAVVVAVTVDSTGSYSRAAVFGYVLALLGLVGGLLGGLVGVVLDRLVRPRRRRRRG